MTAAQQIVDDMRGRAIAAVAGQMFGLGEHQATNTGLAEILASEDPDLQAHLLVALVNLCARAVQGWSNTSAHDVEVPPRRPRLRLGAHIPPRAAPFV